MKPEDMAEILRHATPTVSRVQEHVRPETKVLIEKANELLAIWQEQEKTCDRAWEEQKTAHSVFIATVEDPSSSGENIRTAYQKWRAVDARACPTHYDAQREWAIIRAKAQIALAEDAGLLRSEEEKSYDREETDAK